MGKKKQEKELWTQNKEGEKGWVVMQGEVLSIRKSPSLTKVRC
jgi:hypothetical protein